MKFFKKDFLFHLIFWGVPLACAISIAALIYPKPTYILGAFGGALLGFIISISLVVIFFDRTTEEETSSDTAFPIKPPYTDKYRKEIRDSAKQTEGLMASEAPCSICGKPGFFYNYPNMPVSDFFCEEHTPGMVITPLHWLFFLVILIGIGWLVYTWFFN